MSANNLRLSPWNPAHWLMLLRWFAREPAKLKEYITDLDAEGQQQLELTIVIITGVIAFLPALLLSLLLALQPLFNFTIGVGNVTHWLGEHWYALPLILIALCLSFIAVGLRTGEVATVWVAGLSTLLGLVMIPIIVCLALFLLIAVLWVFQDHSYQDPNSLWYELVFLVAIVVALVFTYLCLKLIGHAAALGSIVQSAERDSESGVDLPLAAAMWLLMSLCYGVTLFYELGPVNKDPGLAGLGFGFLIIADLPLAGLAAALICMLTCALFYKPRSLGGMTIAVAVGVASVIAVGGTLGLTLMFQSQGLMNALQDSLFLVISAGIIIGPIILIYAVIYALVYRQALRIVERHAASLAERYARS